MESDQDTKQEEHARATNQNCAGRIWGAKEASQLGGLATWAIKEPQGAVCGPMKARRWSRRKVRFQRWTMGVATEEGEKGSLNSESQKGNLSTAPTEPSTYRLRRPSQKRYHIYVHGPARGPSRWQPP